MTVPSDEAVGAYSITGDYKDTDHPTPGVTTTGDMDVTVELGDLHIYPGDDFKTIIETAPAGSTIYWHAGTYVGSAAVLIPDSVHIIGDGSDVVELQNIDIVDSVVGLTGNITYSGTSAIIEGLKLGVDSGLELNDVENITIRDCVTSVDQCMLVDSVLVENCIFNGQLYIDNSTGLGIGGAIIRNNIFQDRTDDFCLKIQYANDILVTGNTFQNTASSNYIAYLREDMNAEFSNNHMMDVAALYPMYIRGGSTVIKENTYENCAAADGVFRFNSADATLYMNNFVNSAPYVTDTSSGTVSWESPSAISYAYQGNSYTSVLGNYFDTYSGDDADGDGIGDTAFALASGNDSYPLMGAWEEGNIAGAVILYQGTVELGSDMTCEFHPYNNASAEYNIAPLSAMAALMATGLDLEISDSWYPTYECFSLDNIEDIEPPTETGFWAFSVNGVASDWGIGNVNDTVVDGDVVRFAYTDYMTGEQFYAVEITVEDTGRDDFLYYGSVDLVNGETYKFIPYNNPTNEYDIDSMTAFGALIETGLNTMVSDAWYNAGLGSFFLDAIEGTDTPTDFSTSWDFRVNGVSTTYGVGNVENDTVVDGDLVSFVYWGYTPESECDAVHIHVNEVSYPVLAQRDIASQNFYQGLLSMGQTSTKVTVTLEAREDIDSLSLEEVIPANWSITPSNNDGSIFKANLTDDTRFEWVWAEALTTGEVRTIEYTLTLDEDALADDYYLVGTSSVFVDGADVNDIPVVGEELVKVSDADWNPWNDIDSEGGDLITTAELQSAVNCWLNDLPTPITGATVTTDRLQMLVYYWLNDLPCTEGADA
jgi:hypothetical protein